MLTLNQLVGFGSADPIGFRLEHTDSRTAADATDLLTYTWDDVNFGAPAADRKIVVAVGREGDGTFTGMTIGGVTATEAIEQVNTDPNPNVKAAFYYADVPAGETGQVVVSISTLGNVPLISVYRVVAVDDPEFDEDSLANTSATHARTMNIPAGGGCIAAVCRANNAQTVDWDGLDEDFDDDDDGGNARFSTASRTFTEADAAHVVTATGSGSTGAAMVVLVLSALP